MIASLFWMVVANAATLLGARAMVRRMGTGDGPGDAVLFLLFRLLLVTVAVLAAGLTGTLGRIELGLAGALGLVGLLAVGAHRGLARARFPDLGRLGWVALAVVGGRLLLQVWFFSPHLGDALAYHLPKIGEWVRAGGFTHEMGLHPHVTFPGGFELVETWWVVFLRHDVLIEMAGVEFLILAGAAVFALARRTGLGDRSAFLAAMVYVLTPGLHLSATSCLNDAPAAAMVVATVALVAGRAPMGLIVLAAGLGLGIKPTYAFTLPGMMLLAWWVRKEGRPTRGGWAPAALGIAAGAFWYARNLAWFGDPFYPLGTPSVKNPVAVQLGPRFASLWANVSDLVGGRMADGAAAVGANVDYGAGWGAAAFGAGLVALVAGMREEVRLRQLGAAFLLSLAVSLIFVQNDPWCLKYVFFFPAVLAVAAAWLAERHRGILGVAWAGVFFSFAATFLPYDLPFRHFKELASQSVLDRSAASLEGLALDEDAVGCFGGFRANSYLLYGPRFSRRVVYMRSNSWNELLIELKRCGVRTLYARPGSLTQEQIMKEAIDKAVMRFGRRGVYEMH